MDYKEKVKAYDKALEIAKNIYGASECKDILCTLETIFPELKESVDERIRKVLIDYLHTLPNHFSHNGSLVVDWISWLEKQGEQKPTEWEPQIGDTFRKKGTTSPTYHLCNKLEDGITFSFVENREVGIAGGEINIFALKDDYELVERPNSIEDVVEKELNKELQSKTEQNPAWSEEDASLCVKIQGILSVCKSHSLLSHDLCKEMCDWLKFLKDRVQPQPKQEWSEEDNLNLQCCIAKVQRDINNGWIGTNRELLTWLKSLKERYAWKPSEEQIAALKLASGYLCEKYNREVADSLYNDLMKLKG